jgi:hypothetical protein
LALVIAAALGGTASAAFGQEQATPGQPDPMPGLVAPPPINPAPPPVAPPGVAPAPAPTTAPTTASPAGPSPEALALLDRLSALRARKDALDRRAAALAQAGQPATPEQTERLRTLQFQIQEQTDALTWAAWRATSAEQYAGALRFSAFAAPKARVRIAPRLLLMERETMARLEPTATSRTVATLQTNRPVLKIADLDGLDWILVWIDAPQAFAYLPAGAARPAP